MDIVPYGDEFVKAHREFCSKVWPGKKRRREDDYNRWKFRGPEKGDVEGLLLAVSGEKVLGQLGLIPVTVILNRKEKKSQWACDLMVDPECRKSGIGNKLFAHAFERDMMTIGNNPSPKADALMLKAGFKKIRSGRMMVFPLEASHILKWIIPDKMKFVTPALSGILQIYFSYKSSRLSKRTENFKDCLLEEVSGLIHQNQIKSEQAEVLHDTSFLHWRAAGFKEYSPTLKCTKSEAGSYVVHGDFRPSYNIYDWHCKSMDDTRDLVSNMVFEAGKSECKIIQAIANSKTEEERLGKLGFIRARNEENIIHFSRDGFLDDAKSFRFTLYDTDINL